MANDIADISMTGTDDNVHSTSSATNPASQSSSTNSITVTPTVPYAFDLGNLLLLDTNPFPSSTSTSTSTSTFTSTSDALNKTLAATARDCAQSLVNQLLSTCPIRSTPTGATLTLPPPTTPLPREKRVPKPKQPTRWETFAATKGIASKERKGKMVYDEEKGEWVPKWGYKGANKAGEGDWLVEVDDGDGKDGDDGEGGVMIGGNDRARPSARKGSKEERKERVKRNERRMRANEKRSKKVEKLGRSA